MRCLEKDPAKRPESMIEVAKILDPYYTDIALKQTSATEHPIPTFYDDKTIETSSIDNGDKTVPMTGVARTPNSKSSHPTG